MEHGQLLLSPSTNLRKRRRIIDQLTEPKNWNQHIFTSCVRIEMFSPGIVQRIDDRPLPGKRAVQIIDRIAQKLSSGAETAHLQLAGIGDLAGLFAEF